MGTMTINVSGFIDARGVHRTAESLSIVSGRFSDSVEAASEADVFDGTGYTAIAGLIDTHVHVYDFMNIRSDAEMAAFHREGVKERLEAYLRRGFTTLKSCGDPLDEVLALRADLESRAMRGPRLLVTGPCLTSKDGHPGTTVYRSNPWYAPKACLYVETPADARAAVDRLAARGVDAIKLISEGGCSIADGYHHHFFESDALVRLDPAIMKAAVETAHLHGLHITVHAVQEDCAIDAIEAGADGLEHGVHGMPLQGTRLQALAAERRFFVTGTLVIMQDPPASANIKALHDAGARVVLGTDTCEVVPRWGDMAVDELKALVAAGLSPAQALHAATLGAAEQLGRERELGSLESGKIADVVLLDGNPLVDITAFDRVVAVFRAGELLVDARGRSAAALA